MQSHIKKKVITTTTSYDNKDALRENGTNTKNSPSYISKNKIISIKFNSYTTRLPDIFLNPHS